MYFVKAIGQSFGYMLEKPPYTVVESKDGYEERKYAAAKWVSTTAQDMSQENAVNTSFRKLFTYITGGNELGEQISSYIQLRNVCASGSDLKRTKVDMTAPVATRIVPGAGPNCESTFTVSFYIPPKHQESPPAPKDNSVFIESFPEMTIYASGFGGFADDTKWIAHARELSEKIKDKNFHQEFYFTAGYDAPFKLFNRLNEVWFVKKDS
ncbi:heme-binding protein 2-like isoform X1 [Dreissena polymorpha]|uniref:heme-binding protein 2-like isoform X1 n=1 Tax=Dreissena polymorpha TaxID=45954 RepID=UPI0022650028|nr:heme-binding protein 2-like isoform X1 [Dreissena polymorpha]